MMDCKLHLQLDQRQLALDLLGNGATAETIAKACRVPLRTARGWRTQWQSGDLGGTLARAPTTTVALCFVNECYERRTIGKFCDRHTPELPPAAMRARMMAGR